MIQNIELNVLQIFMDKITVINVLRYMAWHIILHAVEVGRNLVAKRLLFTLQVLSVVRHF